MFCGKKPIFLRRLFKNAPLGVPKLYLHYSLYYDLIKPGKAGSCPTPVSTLFRNKGSGGLIRNMFCGKKPIFPGDFSKMHRLGYLSSISTTPYTTDLIKPGKAGSCPTPVSTCYFRNKGSGGLIRNMFCGRKPIFPRMVGGFYFSKMHRLGYLSSISTILILQI